MICVPVRRDNPRALARGLSTVQAHKPCSISLYNGIQCRPCTLGLARSEGIIDRTGAQTMLYLTCTMVSSVDLAHYGRRDKAFLC